MNTKWIRSSLPYLRQVSKRMLLLALVVSAAVTLLESVHLVSVVWRYLLGLVAIAFFASWLLHYHQVNHFIRNNGRFMLFMAGFTGLSLAYVVGFVLLSYGSPFVYEDPLATSKKTKFETLEPRMEISRDIKASLNNFGTVNLAFKPIVDQDSINSSRLRGKHQVIFKLSERDKEPFYQTSYDLMWYGDQVFIHPFGFPIQETSKHKAYTITISVPEQDNASNLAIAGDIQSLSANERLLVSSRYVFPIAWARENMSDAISVLLLKSRGVLSDQLLSFSILFAAIVLLMVKSFRQHNSIFKSIMYVLPILLLYTIISEASYFFITNRSTTNLFSITRWYYPLLLLLSTLIIGFNSRSQNNQDKKSDYSNTLKVKFMDGSFFKIFVVLLLIVGFILRFSNLGKEAFYHDELTQYQALLGLVNAGELGLYNPFSDEIIAIYPRAAWLTYMSYWLTQIFGVSEGVIRIPVALAGWLLLPIIYWFTKKLSNKWTGLLAMLLVTFNPYLIYLSRFFRNYSFLILGYSLAFLSTMLLLKLSKDPAKHSRLIIKLIICALMGFVLTYHFGIVQAMTLMPIVGISSIIIFYRLILKRRIQSWSIAKTTIIVSFTMGLLSVFTLLLLPISAYFSIAQTHLNLNNINLHNITPYLTYLFSFNLPIMLLILLTASSLYLLGRKKWLLLLPVFTSLYLFVLVAMAGSRYEDFRYISFAIPIVIVAISLAYSSIVKKLNLVYSANSTILMIMNSVIIISALLLPSYPVPHAWATKPPNKLLMPPQFTWNSSEGETYIHRRAVAPQYGRVIEHINSNARDHDIIIVTGSEYLYLNQNFDNVYFLGRNSRVVNSLIHGDDIDINRLINNNLCHPIWITTTYTHLIDQNISQSLLDKDLFINLGKELNILEFDYGNWYLDKGYTWPSLFYRPSHC